MRLLAPHQAVDQLERGLGVGEAYEVGDPAADRIDRVGLRQQVQVAIGAVVEVELRARQRLEREAEARRSAAREAHR